MGRNTGIAASDAAPRRGRRSIVVFFALAFGISWAAWVPAAASSWGLLPFRPPSTVATLIGAFAPTLAAIALTLLGGGLARFSGCSGGS